jgi:hypothetical protein
LNGQTAQHWSHVNRLERIRSGCGKYSYFVHLPGLNTSGHSLTTGSASRSAEREGMPAALL